MSNMEKSQKKITMSKTNKRRLQKDIVDIIKEPLTDNGIYYAHDEENMLKGYAIIFGPDDCIYRYGGYCFEFKFPYDYPFSPPKLKYITNDNLTRFHPNLYRNGKVCISILNTWKGEQWTSCQSIKSVLLMLVTLLHNADRGSMAHSVESRMPFLDFRLVEFLASVPSVYKIHNGWSKYIARLAFDKKLPDSINWRKDKQGWPIPEDAWFLGDLSSWLKNRITFLKDNSRFFNSTEDIAYSKENKRFVLRVLNLLTVLENTNAQIDDTN